MIKLEIEDFIFEIKEEILSYEELGEEKAKEWELYFRKWLNDDSIKKKNIKTDKGNTYYLIGDESEIFDIVDEFYYSVLQNKQQHYWQTFQ